MGDRKLDAAADTAQDTADEPTILTKKELVDLIRRQVDRLPLNKKQQITAAQQANTVNRREFLKMLGIVGAGGLSLAMGAGIIRAEDHIQSITGYAQAKDSGTGKQTKQVTVPSGGTKNFSVSGGDTIQNMYIDISANGADAFIRASGDGWTIGNIGFHGKASRQEAGTLRVNGKNGTIGNVYMGDGSVTHSGNGNGAIAIFMKHRKTTGPIEVKNVHISKFANNGIYGSPTASGRSGQIVNIYNSYFNSNNISAFKLGGPQGPCNVVNTTIKTDESTPKNDGKVNKRTLWALRDKTIVKDSDFQGDIWVDAGATVELQNTRWEGSKQNGGTLTGSSAGSPNLDPPEGVPMSAEAAACMK